MASPKRKPKPKENDEDSEKPQSERFKEAAQKLGADQSGDQFERAFGTIAPPKQRRKC